MALVNIPLKAFAAIKYRRGDNGYLCLRDLSSLNALVSLPLIEMIEEAKALMAFTMLMNWAQIQFYQAVDT